MTHDQIDRMVRQANPVADLSVFEPVDTSVLLDEQGRMEMQTDDRVQLDRGPEKTPRKVLVAIAAAVAVVLGGLIVFQLTGEDTVADAPAHTAEAFLEAFAGFDADTASSYLDEETLESVFGGLEGLRLEIGFWEAVGFRMLMGTCEAGETTSEGVQVQCPYDYHALRSDAMPLGPYTGSHWRFRVLDGQIVSASDDFRYSENGFSSQVWEPFADWVTANHPEDIELMYTDAGLSDMQINEESNRLWEQRSREYVAYALTPKVTSAGIGHLFGGDLTFAVAPPWDAEAWPFNEPPNVITLLTEPNRDMMRLVSRPRPIGEGCLEGPAPSDASALAQAILSDADFEATGPILTSIGGQSAVRIDLVTASGASVCEATGMPMAMTGAGLEAADGQPQGMRLYLVDHPDGWGRVLAIAVMAPETRLDAVVEAALPVLDSIEFQTD